MINIKKVLRDESVDLALLNFSFMLGYSFLIKAGVSMVSLAILAVAITNTYQELTKTFYLVGQFYAVREGLIGFPLEATNIEKLALKLWFLSKFLMKPFYYITIIMLSGLGLFYTTKLFLNDHEWKSYPAILWLFYNIITTITIQQSFALVWGGFWYWFFFAHYLKLKFNEINAKIEVSLKNSDINLLMGAINEHNYVERLTKQLNHIYRLYIFIIYYIATIGFQIFLFLTQKSDTTFLGRIFFGIVFLSCFSAVVFMNVMSTWVSTAAHQPYPIIYSIINKDIRMSFKQRWKLSSFIEKLKGFPIGFYCYNLFAMTNYELYQYLYIAGLNYILIISKFS